MLKYITKISLPLLRPVSAYSRRKRAELFIKKVKLNEKMNILDLGGKPEIWDYIEIPVRSLMIKRWRKKIPDWVNTLEETDVVSVKEMKNLFPEARIMMEWLIFPKSLIAISNDSLKKPE